MKNATSQGKFLFLSSLLKHWLFTFSAIFACNFNFAQPICSGNMIPNATIPITIDANIETTWKKAPIHNLTNANIGALPADFVGSQWRAMYDATYLYILVEVKDAVVRTPDSGNNWWEDDAVEVYIDGDNSKAANYDHVNDIQYGFRNTDPVVHPGNNSVTNTAGVNFYLQSLAGGYTLEVAIPWTTINAGSPFDGKVIGIDVGVDDDDNGGGRDGQIATYAQTDQEFVDPRQFGTGTLTVCIPAPLSILYTSTNPSCFGKTDGTIRVAGEGGEPPYSYSLDNEPAFSSTTGNFSGLAASSIHTVRVKDATGAIVPGAGTINLKEPVDSLVILNKDTSVCAGILVNLKAGGGTRGYVWTINTTPVVAGLSANNIANPVATPSSTTTYTVTSESGANLIPNPDFETGNVGFTSSYTYFKTQTIERKVYAITNSAVNLNQSFTTCGDHTNGTGKMMVVNGSAFNTDTVWFQTVTVNPNTSYTFSYWIQTASQQTAVGQIETQVNGQPITGVPGASTANAPLTASCGNWKQVSYTWNSGASNTANITLYDRNITGTGNDFALDDLYFNTVCPVTKSVTITVDTSPAAPADTITQPNCALPTGTITITAPSSGVTYSFDNGATFQAGATKGNLAPGNYQLVVKNSTGCSSTSTAATINAVSSSPSAPDANVTQPSCVLPTGSITVTAPSGGVTYSFDNGSTFQGNATKSNLVPGTYQVVVKNTIDGCLSGVKSITIDPPPIIPLAPTANPTQPDCVTPTGTITVTIPLTGVLYSFDNGSNFQAGPTSGNLPAGNYQVVVKNASGCVSAATTIIMNAQPVTPLSKL